MIDLELIHERRSRSTTNGESYAATSFGETWCAGPPIEASSLTERSMQSLHATVAHSSHGMNLPDFLSHLGQGRE